MRSMSNPGSFKRTTTSRDELGFQKELLQSVKDQGGYGRKVGHPQLKGISDLLVALPGFSVAQIECKDLAELKAGFDILSGVTEHQKNHIDALNRAAGGLVAFYCFKVKIGDTHRCFFTRDYLERVRYEDLWRAGMDRVGSKTWPDLKRIWAMLGVARLDPIIGDPRPAG